jgi:membrane-associated protein
VDGGPAPANGLPGRPQRTPSHVPKTGEVTTILEQVLGQPAWIVYVVVGLLVLAEDALFVGFVLPGETAALLGGVSVALGHTDLSAMVLVVVAGAVVGDSVGYEVGRHLGPRLEENRVLRHRRHRVEQVRERLLRRGVVTVVLARWTAVLRAVVPALAGAVRMPYRRFLPANLASGVVWGATVVVAGLLAGRSYQQVEQWIGAGSAFVVALVVLVVLVLGRRRRGRGGAGPSVPVPDQGAASVGS